MALATAAEHGRMQLRHLPNGSSAAQLGSTGRWRVRRICIIGRTGSPRSRSEKSTRTADLAFSCPGSSLRSATTRSINPGGPLPVMSVRAALARSRSALSVLTADTALLPGCPAAVRFLPACPGGGLKQRATGGRDRGELGQAGPRHVDVHRLYLAAAEVGLMPKARTAPVSNTRQCGAGHDRARLVICERGLPAAGGLDIAHPAPGTQVLAWRRWSFMGPGGCSGRRG